MVHSANKQPPIKLFELNHFPTAEHYYMAYSGGLDSTALLYALSQQPELAGRLSAIHVNHHIHPDSDHWAEHCQQFCDHLKIPLIKASVSLKDHSEASCREARQQVFQQHLKTNDCLLTAHHLNDQIETVLFRLMRGTGLQGLTGMSRTSDFTHYQIHRPCLNLSQNQLEQYVQANQLAYVEDPSNQDNQYSRNHIRNLVIPAMQQYQPQMLQNMALTIDNLSQSQNILDALIGDNNPFDYQAFNTVELLSTALYHWLHKLKQSAPSQKRLYQFSQDCLSAAADKNPTLPLGHFGLIRWNKQIYAVKSSEPLHQETLLVELNSQEPSVTLPYNGAIQLKSATEVILSGTVRYQQTKEKIQLHHKGPHKTLKKVFQELGIPPWQRKVMPCLYVDDKLVAVGTDITSAAFKSWLNAHKAEYHWLSPSLLL